VTVNIFLASTFCVW